MSGFIERVKISKVLLMQDMDLTEKFVGKSLDEIGSIPFEDILTSGPETCGNENRAESQAEVDAEHTLVLNVKQKSMLSTQVLMPQMDMEAWTKMTTLYQMGMKRNLREREKGSPPKRLQTSEIHRGRNGGNKNLL
ncbi:uncharacterized protein LOC127867109 [Dreissena polymorpha]|uniref:Uncharacterized protein n=1 Tax=Dreissena polymorpha TaxID=45954 RepID=A0A9D4RGQ7_DREPO|nr:uncharacterized protein LOC127867109 [Dreissena polymorpha]KAH3865680.1 hypothetical protein DPMN_028722 [Dreissena polymorpha]